MIKYPYQTWNPLKWYPMGGEILDNRPTVVALQTVCVLQILLILINLLYLKIAPAIRLNMLLHKRFGRYRLYVMAIHECLARLSQFVRHWVRFCASTCHKHHQK